MGKHYIAHVLILFLNLGTLLISLACPNCLYPTPAEPSKPPPPPTIKPPPCPPSTPPEVTPPKPPVVVKPPPYVPKAPSPGPKYPPITPKPPTKPNSPPIFSKPPPETQHTPLPPSQPKETPCPPPPPSPKVQETCPIDTLKLDACVGLLGGLIHIGFGRKAKDTCCPVLEGLVDLDAALCLCTTIKAKVANINIVIPIALEVLLGCGKLPSSGFQCHA